MERWNDGEEPALRQAQGKESGARIQNSGEKKIGKFFVSDYWLLDSYHYSTIPVCQHSPPEADERSELTWRW
jgi:hypothetical protein